MAINRNRFGPTISGGDILTAFRRWVAEGFWDYKSGWGLAETGSDLRLATRDDGPGTAWIREWGPAGWGRYLPSGRHSAVAPRLGSSYFRLPSVNIYSANGCRIAMDPSKPKDTPSSASRRQAQQDAYDDLLEGFSWFSTKSSPLYTTTYGLSSSTVSEKFEVTHYCRYVDDTFRVVDNSRDVSEDVLKFLNNRHHPCLKYILGKESDISLKERHSPMRPSITPSYQLIDGKKTVMPTQPYLFNNAGESHHRITLRTAPKRRNVFVKITKQETTEIGVGDLRLKSCRLTDKLVSVSDKTWASLFSEPAAEHVPSPPKTADKTWASLFSEPAAEHVSSPPKTADKSWASLFSEPAAEHAPSPPKTADKSWASLFSEPAAEDVSSPSNTGGHFSLFSDGSTDNIDEAEINAFEKAEGPIPHHIMQMWSLPHPTEEFMNSMLSKKDYGPVGSKRKQGPPPPVAQRESGSECGFCRHNGEMRSVWASHNLKDSKGNVVCPILRRHVCRLCGATREKAHTLKYCPKCVITDDCFIHCPSCCPIFKETD
ncbi:hypothetical protein AAG570_005535 [Ranatra chinensis]|uniref:Nanos-type domain-containing protein n=1 Tax=Ranatra chinensis TaxID=642074 RepID=A0ABD0XZE4_9HEMI